MGCPPLKLPEPLADKVSQLNQTGVSFMHFTKGTAVLAIFLSSVAFAAPRGNKSTISFSRSEGLVTTPAKKRNFKHDIDAVAKSHQHWKKAHLNKVLYACQKNGEETAALAKKVAEKMDSSEVETTKEAKALAKSLTSALNEASDPSAALLTDQQREQLRNQLTQLESVQKKSLILERLAGQVKKYYVTDAPRTSPFGGGCPVSYSTALQRGTEASTQYFADTQALRLKLEGLTKRARTVLNSAKRSEMFAGR